MEHGRLPGLVKMSRCMRILADTPLESQDVKRLCIKFGWALEPETVPHEHDGYMQFQIQTVDRSFHVTLTDGVVKCGVLPLVFWEDYDPADHDSDVLYRRARLNFDRKYEKALQQTAKVIGSPLRTWVQEDEDRFKKALWQGKHSLLVLQQDDYDEQFGFDINFLLQAHQGPLPETLQLCV